MFVSKLNSGFLESFPYGAVHERLVLIFALSVRCEPDIDVLVSAVCCRGYFDLANEPIIIGQSHELSRYVGPLSFNVFKQIPQRNAAIGIYFFGFAYFPLRDE